MRQSEHVLLHLPLGKISALKPGKGTITTSLGVITLLSKQVTAWWHVASGLFGFHLPLWNNSFKWFQFYCWKYTRRIPKHQFKRIYVPTCVATDQGWADPLLPLGDGRKCAEP